MINVWQTIELISGNDLKQYIDGYSKDVQQFLDNLTKHKNFNVKKNEFDSSDYNLNKRECTGNDNLNENDGDKNTKSNSENVKISEKLSHRKQKKKKIKNNDHKINEYFECSVNVSQLNGKFQRLMGTNVIRLTDKNYMKELRQRLAEEYNQMLMKRIAAREQKEIERERNLIMEGKSKIIPDQLFNHSTFIVNNNGREFKSRRRPRLKTAHERNIERLKRLQSKWEKEFMDNQNKLTDKDEQNKLQYEDEIADKEATIDEKFDITNETLSFQDLNQKLDEILSPVSDKYSSVSLSPIDSNGYESDTFFNIGNIVLARQIFRSTERKYQKELDDKFTKSGIKFKIIKDLLTMASLRSSNTRKIVEKEIKTASEVEKQNDENIIGENHCEDNKKTDPLKSKQIIDKTKMNLSKYQKGKIAELKKANSVNELYELAEAIILGDLYGDGKCNIDMNEP